MTAARRRRASGGKPTTLTFVNSSVVEAASISLPAGSAAGDLGILLDGPTSGAGSSTPTGVTPSGFSLAADVGAAPDTAARMRISYKVLDAADITAGSVSGMTGATVSHKTFITLRPNAPISSVTAGGVNGEVTAGNPVSQTIGASGGVGPLVLLGHISNFSADASPTGTLVTSGTHIVAVTTNRRKTYYEIQNSSPADRTFDMGDVGALNAIQSCYLAVS